jgi:hypothetical protein
MMSKIHEAIRNVQAQVTSLEQTTATIEHRGGGQHSYTYLAEPTLMEFLRPLLTEAGIATYVSCEDRGKDGNLSKARAIFRFVHIEDDSEVFVTFDGQATAADDKGQAMANTSAVRQGLHKQFMVPNWRDDPEQRQAPEHQSQEIEQAKQQVTKLAEGKGLTVYAQQQIAKAGAAVTIDYLRDLYKAISQAEPAAEGVAPAPPAASPENGSQGVLDPRLADLLRKLSEAKPGEQWITRLQTASQTAFNKPPNEISSEQADRLVEKLEQTLLAETSA